MLLFPNMCETNSHTDFRYIFTHTNRAYSKNKKCKNLFEMKQKQTQTKNHKKPR